jgi:hypothetical protein
MHAAILSASSFAIKVAPLGHHSAEVGSVRRYKVCKAALSIKHYKQIGAKIKTYATLGESHTFNGLVVA